MFGFVIIGAIALVAIVGYTLYSVNDNLHPPTYAPGAERATAPVTATGWIIAMVIVLLIFVLPIVWTYTAWALSIP